MKKKKSTNYHRGAAAERYIKSKFPPPRYYVMRSSGSHGEYDLFVLDKKTAEGHLIQSKRQKPSGAEIDRMAQSASEIPRTIRVIPQLWHTVPHGKARRWTAINLETGFTVKP